MKEQEYDITYSCNGEVLHEKVLAVSIVLAIEELNLLIQADYVDVLGVTVEDLPRILQENAF